MHRHYEQQSCQLILNIMKVLNLEEIWSSQFDVNRLGFCLHPSTTTASMWYFKNWFVAFLGLKNTTYSVQDCTRVWKYHFIQAGIWTQHCLVEISFSTIWPLQDLSNNSVRRKKPLSVHTWCKMFLKIWPTHF